MKFLFDTANIEDIRRYSEFFPIAGITSNPSIIKKEGKIDFFNHFKEIREIIGRDKDLHIQILAEDAEGILKETETILENVDDKVCIKVPVTEQGLKGIRTLKAKGISVTATAIYTKIQGLLAIEAGADFIAPYFNRMENMDINPREVISTFANMISEYNYSTKILAASFKNIGQVNDAFAAGAQMVTVSPDLLHTAFKMPSIQKAVDDFVADWKGVFGEKVSICDLPNN
ncbi:fructose-6-phosphate aldolase [Clostridium pasteurianum]|uniref:Transaldolase n=1 Tax=Clostridium pasteurianum BC1 TaxID=86416 RepID=R4JZB7_CLOPA|nr:fructose-6-phosphate aldolase [Clostridium pasteurianum]AGK95648.1 transaldolase [Clostridium pasteurianum BC1]